MPTGPMDWDEIEKRLKREASDFRDRFFPDSKLFRREVTSVEIRSPWSEVDA